MQEYGGDAGTLTRPPVADRRGSLMDRLLDLRNRLLANPRFQRWAVAFPLTRPIANRRARALFDLCAGFVYSQVLFACVQLRLFDLLSEGPQTLDALSRRLSLSSDATARLLAAAVSLQLVDRRGPERFGLGPLGAALLGNAGVAQMIEHHALLYGDLHDPVALLRAAPTDTALSRFWAYAGADRPDALATDQVSDYSALMAASQSLIAEDILGAYPLNRHRFLLDVGGGTGAFAIAAATRVPTLRAAVFDLPAVAERARERMAERGVSDRCTATGGDFRFDPLPEGADVVSLVRILHDHNDDVALAVLKNIRRALPDRGTLLVAEPMSRTPGAEPIGDAYFGFYLLAMGRGRPRTADELGELLRHAGFGKARQAATRTPLLTRLIVAQPARG